jgi:hypothetical protein
MAQSDTAPAIVQNLNMASDLYGDRSNIRNPYDTGVQLFTNIGSGANFIPIRGSNTHLLNGESEKRPNVGCDFTATFNWSSFLPKGFASDQFYYAVTSIGITPLAFGLGEHDAGVSALNTGKLVIDGASQGVEPASVTLLPGQVLGTMYRATFTGAWMEYKQDGRKTSFVFDHLLNIPAVTTLNDAAGVGLSLQSNRAMLPVPFLLSPRNTNQSQEVLELHFADLNPISDLSGLAETSGGTEGYALVYKLDFGGYFCDAAGTPANQEYTLASARAAASCRYPLNDVTWWSTDESSTPSRWSTSCWITRACVPLASRSTGAPSRSTPR